ncbi:MAG: hypothetical protein U9Q31_01190 [Chloroflexota bacterium]|nr:hypothetical protein [Chloroflexota bacterium]
MKLTISDERITKEEDGSTWGETLAWGIKRLQNAVREDEERKRVEAKKEDSLLRGVIESLDKIANTTSIPEEHFAIGFAQALLYEEMMRGKHDVPHPVHGK